MTVKTDRERFEELAKDSDHLIASPEKLQELKAQGVPFKITPSKTLDEEFADRLVEAKKIITQLPELPDPISHSVRLLYQEIRECIFFGLNGAAITMCGILIEYILKLGIYAADTNGSREFDADKWDKLEENIELSSAIDMAKSRNLDSVAALLLDSVAALL